VSSPHSSDPTVRFGDFTVDLGESALYRKGERVRLQGQPFAVLTVLLERPGRLVDREDLQRRLWPNDTFVDFEHGLNAAVNRLREALGDSAETPQYIETVPRRGYRFIGQIETHPGDDVSVRSRSAFSRGAFHVFLATLLLLAVIGATIWWWFSLMRLPRVTGSTRLTFSGRVSGRLFGGVAESFPSLVTDGNRIYFVSVKNGSPGVAYISVTGGDAAFLPTTLDYPELRGISPDGSTLLVYGAVHGQSDEHLWFVSSTDPRPRRLMNTDGQDGAWSPDGRRFVFANDVRLYSSEPDGSNVRELSKTRGKAYWIRWSPDSTRIRFTTVDQSTGAYTMWECAADGSNLHPLILKDSGSAQMCCGQWLADGRYFVFRISHENHAELWLARERDFGNKVHLGTGPLDAVAAVPSLDGHKLFFIGLQPKVELHQYELRTGRVSPLLAGTSAFLTSSSPNGQWIAYVEQRGKDSILWRARPDGSDRIQLTEPPMLAGWSSWSRDSSQLAFMGKPPDRPWTIFTVAAGGGAPRAVSSQDHNAVDPEWSPDGKELMFGRPPIYMVEASAPRALYLLTLTTGKVSTVPGSEGLYSPHWSTDGRYVVAMPTTEDKLMLFDNRTQQWTKLLDVPLGIATARWSRDGEYIYFDRHVRDALMRVRRATGVLEKVLDLRAINPNTSECDFDNVAADGSLLIACWLDDGDIYEADLDSR
jgi:Tol biopolymer transport system component/DNA-binding winged helix-turn-helix (wHTH) protein